MSNSGNFPYIHSYPYRSTSISHPVILTPQIPSILHLFQHPFQTSNPIYPPHNHPPSFPPFRTHLPLLQKPTNTDLILTHVQNSPKDTQLLSFIFTCLPPTPTPDSTPITQAIISTINSQTLQAEALQILLSNTTDKTPALVSQIQQRITDLLSQANNTKDNITEIYSLTISLLQLLTTDNADAVLQVTKQVLVANRDKEEFYNFDWNW